MLSNFMKCWESEGEGNLYELLDALLAFRESRGHRPREEMPTIIFFSNI